MSPPALRDAEIPEKAARLIGETISVIGNCAISAAILKMPTSVAESITPSSKVQPRSRTKPTTEAAHVQNE
jgi:hypothetical protein